MISGEDFLGAIYCFDATALFRVSRKLIIIIIIVIIIITRTHDAKEDLVNSVPLRLTHRSSEEG